MMPGITSHNLPADLPENSGWGDVIAPNGADIGKPKQHGYNYLNQQVNDTQKAVNQLASESTAELSNKAKGNPVTGDALNAEKLGEVAANRFAQTTPPITWKPELRGDVIAGAFTYVRQVGTCVIQGKVATIAGTIEISNISVVPNGMLEICTFPVVPKQNEVPVSIAYARGGRDASVSSIILASMYGNRAVLRVMYFSNNSVNITAATQDQVQFVTGLQNPTVTISFGATFEIA